MIDKQIDKEIDRILESEDREDVFETLSVLGDKIKLCNIELPSPTIGVLSVLDVLQNPFITGEIDKISPHTIFEALYVLKNREQVITEVYQHLRTKEKLDNLQDKASKDKGLFEVYLKQLSGITEQLSEFDRKVEEFGLSLGAQDPAILSQGIQEYIALCMRPLEMLPEDKETVGVKKKDSTENG